MVQIFSRIKICKALAVLILLYVNEIWSLRKKDKNDLHQSRLNFSEKQPVQTTNGMKKFFLEELKVEPRHQPATTWVNTTRYRKYSQVLVMMGENIARNM